MDKNFIYAVAIVLKHEGGYVNNPNDPGGETNFGISKRSFPNLDIVNLTKEQATEIYYTNWWLKFNYSKINDREIAAKIFDLSVNMGQSSATKVLQRALHAANQKQISVDGIMGPQTINAANRADSRILIGAIRSEAAHHYRKLIERNPNLKVFENGWMNRAYS